MSSGIGERETMSIERGSLAWPHSAGSGSRPTTMTQGLRIALVAPPWFPVPPPGYGGIEYVVAKLADGLAARGHEVTLFAPGGSKTQARLESRYDEAPSALLGN